MKQLFFLLSFIAFVTISCHTPRPLVQSDPAGVDKPGDTTIVQSLFNDRSSSITEDNIQRILDGSYKLPAKIRIAIVRLENPRQQHYFWSDESYIKTQQSYLDSFATRLKASSRVAAIATIPEIIISKSPSFTSIREAAVRMQCDMVLVYSISGDIYSRYKFFSTPDIKAFATAQVMFMDVRTGLIPFSTTVTRDYLSRKTKDDLDLTQTRDRILNEAGLATINDAGERITGFLATN
jgi:hypothetical protein